MGQCFWGHGGAQTWGHAWGWQKLRGPSGLFSERSHQVFHVASLPCPYVSSWSACRVEIWSSVAMVGQLVGKEKPPVPTQWVFRRPRAGRKPRCLREESCPSTGETSWEKQLLFHKPCFHPCTSVQ